jgi:hypothetical protein
MDTCFVRGEIEMIKSCNAAVLVVDLSAAKLLRSIGCNIAHCLYRQTWWSAWLSIECRGLGMKTKLEWLEEMGQHHTLMPSTFSCARSPRSIRRCISSIMTGRLRPFTKTLSIQRCHVSMYTLGSHVIVRDQLCFSKEI